jgi:predicted deacetylase
LKDLPTAYWLDYNMANMDLEHTMKENPKQIPGKFSIVTIHDVSPKYKAKIMNILHKIDELEIPYNIAIIPYHDEKKKNDIRNNREFINYLLEYSPETALHGLYHEHDGNLEEFHNLNLKSAREEIRKGVKIFQEVGIGKNHIFIPPTWAVNKDTVDALKSLQFKLVETEEEIILLDKNVRLLSNILNWDLGSLKTDNKYATLIKKLFNKKLLLKSRLIRIALHPRDPNGVLDEQYRMIQTLKRAHYQFLTYSEIHKIFN